MKQTLEKLEGLSLASNGFNFSVTNKNSQNLIPENKRALIKLLKEHHNFFDNLEDFYQNADLKVPYNRENSREEYSRLYCQVHQEIRRQQSLLSTQEKLAERYETLFKRYDKKLKNQNLTNRQRMRYQKLWIQYGMLYAQYGKIPSMAHGDRA